MHIIEEKFVNVESENIFIFKIEELIGSIQHNDKLYSKPLAGGRLFFTGTLNQSSETLEWNNWIPSGISFYFAAIVYFPSAEIINLH